MKILKLLFTVLFLVNCSSSKKIIQGDWYTLENINTEINSKDLTKNYTEYFFSDDKVYRYNNFMAFLSPYNYIYKKDSLFILHKKEDFFPKNKKDKVEFIGKIEFINKDSFVMTNKENKLIFKKIKKGKKMSDYIIVTPEIGSFYKPNLIHHYSEAFFKRLNKLTGTP